VIDMVAVMGGVDLLLPRDWTVDVQAVPILGGVEDKRFEAVRWRGRRGRDWLRTDPQGAAPPDATAPPAPDAAQPDASRGDAAPGDAGSSVKPRLVVRGFIMMGGLNIES
jgi:hypothetical protein